MTELHLFSRPAWDEEMSLLLHLARYGNALLLIVGDQGLGKTIFLQRFCQSIREDFSVYQLNATVSLSAAELLDHINHAFDLPHTLLSDGEISTHAKAQLESMTRSQRQYLVAIDDAHWLSDGALLVLACFIRMQTLGRTHLHFVLSGSLSIHERVDALFLQQQLRQASHVIYLQPFTQQETARYLQTYFSEQPFTKSELFVEKLQRVSRGYPGKINALLADEQFTRQPWTLSKKVASRKWLKDVYLAGALVSLTVIMGVGYLLTLPIKKKTAMTHLIALKRMPAAAPPPYAVSRFHPKLAVVQQDLSFYFFDPSIQQGLQLEPSVVSFNSMLEFVRSFDDAPHANLQAPLIYPSARQILLVPPVQAETLPYVAWQAPLLMKTKILVK